MLNSCICPDHEAIYECTVYGGRATIWQGTALQTALQGCIDDPTLITLNHNEFDLINRSCAISGIQVIVQAISLVNDSYTSRLTLQTVSQHINGTTLECTTDDGLNYASKQILLTTGML